MSTNQRILQKHNGLYYIKIYHFFNTLIPNFFFIMFQYNHQGLFLIFFHKTLTKCYLSENYAELQTATEDNYFDGVMMMPSCYSDACMFEKVKYKFDILYRVLNQ